MAAIPNKGDNESPAAPIQFSYAQAAKGLSSAGKPATQPGKSHTDAVPSSKEPSSTGSAASETSVTDNLDTAASEVESMRSTASVEQSRNPEDKSSPGLKATQDAGVQANDLLRQVDESFNSLQVNEDDISSTPNMSTSDSPWDGKSQASTAVEKPIEQDANVPDHGKRAEPETEQKSSKAFHEAPVPTVNVWKQRAEEAKAKAAGQGSSSKSNNGASGFSSSESSSGGNDKANTATKTDIRRKANSVPTLTGEAEQFFSIAKDQRRESELDPKGSEAAKTHQPRRSSKPTAERDSDHQQKGSRPTEFAKPNEQDVAAKPASTLPPVRDDASWPTPESAQDEEKRRAQGKGEKAEREKSAPTPRPHGKNGWVPVPYTPSVVFNTPLPPIGSRRGGRGGGRAGRDGNGRGPPSGMNGSVANETAPLESVGHSSGDHGRRGRPDARNASPSRVRRAASAGSLAWRESRLSISSSFTDRPSKNAAAGESGSQSSRPSFRDDATSGSNTLPRQSYSGRQRPYRKYENDTRREGETVQPRRDSKSPPHSRRMSAAAQTDDHHGRRANSLAMEGQKPPTRPVPTDRRGDSRSLEFNSHRERADNRGRGNMRIRGGAHAYGNNHHVVSQQLGNNHLPPLTNTTYPPPKSPAFSQQSGSTFPPAPQQSRGFRNGGHRPASLYGDIGYGRQTAYATIPPNVAPVQTYVGGAYEYSGPPPMSAVPYSPYMDQYSLLGMVAMQLEYYFSVGNLCKDMFLRKHMDSQGFVFLTVIADFNRIKQLTTDIELIKLVCYQSRNIDYQLGGDGRDRLRKREGWEQWVLSVADRDPSVQNDGPTELHHPPLPYPQGLEYPPLLRQPASATAALPPYSNGGMEEAIMQASNGAVISSTFGPAEPSMPESGNHANSDGPFIVSSAIANGSKNGKIQPKSEPSAEDDSFLEKQIETLSVIVRKQDQAAPHANVHPAAHRTFSNGSIDGKGIVDEPDHSAGHGDVNQVNGYPQAQLEDSRTESAEAAGRGDLCADTHSHSHPVRLYWVKDLDAPVEQLPADSTHESYAHLRLKALNERQLAAIGTCPYDMDVLYQFWSHFLIRNFNSGMYDEFRQFALEDVAQRLSDVGVRNLIKFYSESLSSQGTIRERVARDYVDLVVAERSESERPAFKLLRSAWRDGALNPKNRKKISAYIDDGLRSALEL